MRYQLKFKDGKILEGTVIGELGTSLLFRDERSNEGIRVIHINELQGAWKIGTKKEENEMIPSQVVTYMDDFRVISVEDVEDLTSNKNISLSTKYPPPSVYYEVDRSDGKFIFSCENNGLEYEDVETRIKDGIVDIYLIETDSPKQLSFDLGSISNTKPRITVNDQLIEIEIEFIGNVDI